jgi:hypothetical protein
MAAAWSLARTPVPLAALAALAATDRLVVAGPGAIAATILAFARDSALDWAEQVVCVATPPAHRQLALAATALLNASRPTRLAAAHDHDHDAPHPHRRLVLSADADAADAARARDLARDLAPDPGQRP